MAALPRFHTARGAEPLSRGSALLQVALAMLLLTAWMLAVRQSGLAAWIARSVGAWSLVAAVVRREALLPLRVLLQVPVRPPREAPAVEELLLHRSFLAATAGRLTSTGIPRSAPVPRSRRKPNSRP